MNVMQRNKIQNMALSIAMIVMLAILSGCELPEQAGTSTESQVPVGQSDEGRQPLGHVIEFDGFTLRANVLRTDILPEAVARQYGIEPEPDVFLLNVVILENLPDRQPAPVPAEVSAQHKGLSGHGESIDMRAVEADGHVSYIGRLNASAQDHFQLIIDAQPAGTDEMLKMTFEVHLEAFETGDSE
jgi:hypothetical protein